MIECRHTPLRPSEADQISASVCCRESWRKTSRPTSSPPRTALSSAAPWRPTQPRTSVSPKTRWASRLPTKCLWKSEVSWSKLKMSTWTGKMKEGALGNYLLSIWRDGLVLFCKQLVRLPPILPCSCWMMCIAWSRSHVYSFFLKALSYGSGYYVMSYIDCSNKICEHNSLLAEKNAHSSHRNWNEKKIGHIFAALILQPRLM